MVPQSNGREQSRNLWFLAATNDTIEIPIKPLFRFGQMGLVRIPIFYWAVNHSTRPIFRSALIQPSKVTSFWVDQSSMLRVVLMQQPCWDSLPHCEPELPTIYSMNLYFACLRFKQALWFDSKVGQQTLMASLSTTFPFCSKNSWNRPVEYIVGLDQKAIAYPSYTNVVRQLPYKGGSV